MQLGFRQLVELVGTQSSAQPAQPTMPTQQATTSPSIPPEKVARLRNEFMTAMHQNNYEPTPSFIVNTFRKVYANSMKPFNDSKMKMIYNILSQQMTQMNPAEKAAAEAITGAKAQGAII